MRRMQHTAIDLFCGAGGLSAGLEMAGFRVLAGNDIFASGGKTFEASHPHAKFLLRPVEKLSPNEILEVTGLRSGELTVLAGGPPCQAYSIYNHQRGMQDSRATLFREYLRIVEGLRPEWIIMENVTGIYSIGGGKAVNSIKAELATLGYEVSDAILRAEDYGVPQLRRRVVFIGNRIGAPISHPKPTHGPGTNNQFTTIFDAIGDLPSLINGEDPGRVPYADTKPTKFQRQMRRNSKSVANHAAPRLGDINLKRLQHIPQGGSWRDIPYDLLPNGMKRARRSDHTKRYGRMNWDSQSCTVLTKCDIHWGAFIHPEQDRAISVREAARLQAFPDRFEFAGSKTEQYIQVGNAVPPPVGKAIGEQILRLMATPNLAVA